jgi:hypothetical protein
MPDEVLDSSGPLLGPLAALAGVWEGDEGDDFSPSAERGEMTTPYRERMVFEPLGSVDNHEQVLQGLRYSTTAWRIGEQDPFHEELGYWLWDAGAGQVMRCFMVPRGVTILAGGTVAADDASFELAADVGSETFGICSNPFLDREFKTVRYELKISVNAGVLAYEEDTQLQMAGRTELFHHRDSNRLTKAP